MSRFWSTAFRVWYRVLARFGPLVHIWLTHARLGNVVELVAPGRRSGQPRRVPLGLLRWHGAWYLGHPNGHTAWTINLDAADGSARLHRPGAPSVQVRATLIGDGAERDGVIRTTWHQHVFPGNVLYWLARRHIFAVGRYYRIDLLEPPAADVAASGIGQAGVT